MADALDRNRERLNAKFALLRKSGAPVDGDALLDHLAEAVEPVVRKVSAIVPARVDSTLLALYELSLELMSSSLLGANGKYPVLRDVWARLLPALAEHVARDPRRVTGCLCNAAYNVACASGARPVAWLEAMLTLGPGCEDPNQLLECGKVAAWRAGMAQYRTGALAAAKGLPPKLAAAALGLAKHTSSESISTMIEKMIEDPWLTPDAAAAMGLRRLRVVARAGSFRGFGGDFIRPPRVFASGSHVYATDGDGTWRILADVFGCVLVRDSAATQAAGNQPVTVAADGTIKWMNDQEKFASLANSTSFACAGRTLAVTVPNSHHVFLVARKVERG
jgi:hypothetical protein